MKQYNKYIFDVFRDKIIVGKKIKLSIKRHLQDLEKSKNDDYPYFFDEDEADRVIDFVKMCKLSGDDFQGTYFPIQDFQAWYFAMVYGWRRKTDNIRKYRRVYWCTARKSAKSEMTAPECIFQLFSNKGKVQVCCCATTFQQAKYIYDPIKYMTRELKKDSEAIDKIAKITQYEIKNLSTDGYITRLTADHKTNDGAGIVFGVIDEFHAHPDDSMVGVVSTSQGTSKEPILKIVTTAGFNKNGPDYEFRQYCKKVLNGQIQDENLFIAIYDLDEDDDWHDESTWIKSNPMIGITPTWDFMRSEYAKAVNEGGEKIVQFLTKNLNKYTDAASVWIDTDIYDRCKKNIQKEDLKGLYCVVGVDLASEHDLTSVNYYFPRQKGLEKPYYFTNYYCPAKKFENVRVDGVIYSQFLDGGWIKKTEGNAIDKDSIKNDILQNAEIFEIKLIGYDPYKSIELMSELNALGFECAKISQSSGTLGSGNSHWKELLLRGDVEHDGSPVTKWQMGNIEMYTDGNGNQKILKSKGKKENKVDGPVAICNSIVAYLDYIKMDQESELTMSDLGEL